MNGIQSWFGRRGRADATGRPGGVQGRVRPAARRRARPEVFALEDRRLLATFVVTDPADSLTNGVPTPNTLRWAVDRANQAVDPSVIEFNLGRTPKTITLTQGVLELRNTTAAITIEGPGSGLLAVSGNDASGIFQVGRSEAPDPNKPMVRATISGLELEHGSSSFGGAISNYGNLTVLDCLFLNNVAPPLRVQSQPDPGGPIFSAIGPGVGGAITSYNGTLSLVDCTLTGNSANFGGAIASEAGYYGSSSLSLTNCTLSGNTTTVDDEGFIVQGATGGAIFGQNIYGELSIALTGCTISGNTAADNHGYGGGMSLFTSGGNTALSLTACTLSGNSSGGIGGGLDLYGGAATLTNCTLSGNTAGQGGGIHAAGASQLSLVACTISGNSATNGAGGGLNGVASYNGFTHLWNTPQARLTDTIIAGNHGPGGQASDIGGDDRFRVTGSYNLIGTGGSGGLSEAKADHNLINVADPRLAPLGDYGGATQTMALLPGSPALHRGTAVPGVTTDQRGLPLDKPVDIGAYQRHRGHGQVDEGEGDAGSDASSASPSGPPSKHASGSSDGVPEVTGEGRFARRFATDPGEGGVTAPGSRSGGLAAIEPPVAAAPGGPTILGFVPSNAGGPGSDPSAAFPARVGSSVARRKGRAT
jgi:hypothetical protein